MGIGNTVGGGVFRLLLLSLGFIAAKPAQPSSTDTSKAIASLELVAKYDAPVREMKSTARDIRWASKNSIYLGFDGDGVLEFSLGELLSEEDELYPPRNRSGARSIPNVFNIAFDDRYLLAWGPANVVGWREVGSAGEITVKKLPGYFDDVDVRGGKVAILGYPSVDDYVANDHAYIWLGDLRSELAEWLPLYELSMPPGVKARSTFSRFLGSLRFLANGDLLVFPEVKPGVFRHGQSGKLKEFWSLAALEASLVAALGGDELRVAEGSESEYTKTEPELDTAKILDHVASLRLVVEDVLPIRKSPAIVVRYRSSESAAFYLGVLSPEPTWYKLPFGKHDPSVRVRTDYSEESDRLVFLVTDRSLPRDGSNKQIYVVSAP